MDSLIKKAYRPDNFRKKGHALIDLLADYLEKTVQDDTGRMFRRFDPDELVKKWESKLSSPAERESGVMGVVNDVMQNSIHLHNPGYMGHQVSPVLPESALAELVSALCNNGVGVYEMGSPTVALERVVVKELAERIGFPETSDGFLTSGGTLGNLTALLAARQIKSENEAWEEGTGGRTPGVLVSEQAHYGIDRAVKIMGWGEKGIVKVPVDDRYRMDADSLRPAYARAKKRGIEVLGVVGSACSTATGSFDPLKKIAAFCRQEDLWFHVDAAHGGGAAYSETYRHLLEGIEQADSVVVDFHKMLMQPALVTGVLFREGDHSYRTFAQKADYLWSKEDMEWFNLGKRTFECTKDMMALKVYSTLQAYGPGLFDEIVTRQFELGKRFAALIRSRPGFELLLEPECNIVCFRHHPEGVEDVNRHNELLRRRIIDKGEYFIVQARMNGEVYLRTALMNVFTGDKQLKGLLEAIEKESGQLVNS